MPKLRDLANDAFARRYGLEPYFPENHSETGRPFETHTAFHLFSKTRQNSSSDYANRPTYGGELIADIYEVVMQRFQPIAADSENYSNRQTSVLGEGSRDLTLEEITIFNEGRRRYLEELFKVDNIRPLPEHLIEYHASRALWIRDNIAQVYGNPFYKMSTDEWGEIDLDKVFTRSAENGDIAFEQWRLQMTIKNQSR